GARQRAPGTSPRARPGRRRARSRTGRRARRRSRARRRCRGRPAPSHRDVHVMSLHTNARVRSILDLIGNTPLVRLRSVEARAGTGAEVWAKCEFDNPGGSVKDRAARQMIVDALADGRLGGGRTLIDSTSGNTGVAYSMIGAALGVKIALVMPANVSVARTNIT